MKKWLRTNLSPGNSISATGTIVFPEATHREKYFLFPENWRTVDYVIIDRERLHWIKEEREKLSREIEIISRTRNMIYKNGRVLIYQ